MRIRYTVAAVCMVGIVALGSLWGGEPRLKPIDPKKVVKFKKSDALIPKADLVNRRDALVLARPDLYIVKAADLTDITKSGPLSSRMWVTIGNQGKATASNVRVDVSFWKLVSNGGTTSGKIYHTRTMTIPSLAPGATVTLNPYNLSSTPICWSVKVDSLNAIKELREDNNRTGRMWAMYPDAFLRAYSYEAAP